MGRWRGEAAEENSMTTSDRVCIRGCTQLDVHYASCEHHGPAYDGEFPCRGCAPRECRDGSLICDRCFGRLRGLLGDARDMLGRLYAIADPAKATPLDQVRVASSSVEPPAPVGADVLDAIAALEQIVEWAYVDLSTVTNDLDTITWLCAAVLDRHPEIDGIRPAWSLQDAVDKWGIERRERAQRPYVDLDDPEEETMPIPEWQNPIVGREDAERIAGSAATLRRWVKAGAVAPVGEVYIAGRRTRLFRVAELEACKARMSERAASGRYGKKAGS